ncbi:MAG: hypothetical protein WC758_01030 [Candidatus Woesearchaeota archaeon]
MIVSTTRKRTKVDYSLLEKKIKEDILDISFTTKKIFDDGVDIIRKKCQTSANSYSSTISYFIDSFCEIAKNKIDDVFIVKQDELKNVSDCEKNITDDKCACDFEKKDKVCVLEEIVSGKYVNSYNVKTRIERRMWRWDERIKYIEGLFLEDAFDLNDFQSINNIRTRLLKNSYLHRKRRDVYDKLNVYFDNYCLKYQSLV